ncbi:MAG: S49 family peptidase [Pseudomonadota bacterium]
MSDNNLTPENNVESSGNSAQIDDEKMIKNNSKNNDKNSTISNKKEANIFLHIGCKILTIVSKTIKKLIKICNKEEPVVNVIRISGVIGQAGGLKKGLSFDSLNESITKSFSKFKPKAVILQINSPGGSPVQSELIYNRIRQLSVEKEIPVYTFIEDVGASGGYWLACAGDKIYASKSSIVGSIGVIASGFGFVEAIEKIGVERRVHTQGENKSILDPFKPEKETDIKIISEIQKNIHDAFKDLVKERREGKINPKSKKIFSGEFWSGMQALELGLIDEIGVMHNILYEKFGKKVKINKMQRQKGWFKSKIGIISDDIADSLVNSSGNAINNFIQNSRFKL